MPSDLRSPMAFLKRRISSAVEIREVSKDKKKYLALLMSADEQEDMIDRYIERGRMFVLWEDGAKGECVITDEGNGVLEIKKGIWKGFDRLYHQPLREEIYDAAGRNRRQPHDCTFL